jgi:hypothetical protein
VTPFEPSDAEHIVQCELGGCVHPPAIYADDETNPADTSQGWCDLAAKWPRAKRRELITLGSRRRRPGNVDGAP